MKPIKKVLLLAASCLMIAGCDRAKETFADGMKTLHNHGYFKQPQLVITPGWLMDNPGRAAALSGDSHCPGKRGLMVMETGCIVIGNATNEVMANVTDLSGHATKAERWTVERSGVYPDIKILLRRPDNSYVSAWKEPLKTNSQSNYF